MKVLIIETDSEWIVVMQKFFDFYQITHIAISNLEQTQETIKSSLPDVIFLNLMVHNDESAGLAILSAIKSDPDTRDTPVVVMSGDYLERGKDRALQMGAYTYVSKQFVPQELAKLLETLKI